MAAKKSIPNPITKSNVKTTLSVVAGLSIFTLMIYGLGNKVPIIGNMGKALKGQYAPDGKWWTLFR